MRGCGKLSVVFTVCRCVTDHPSLVALNTDILLLTVPWVRNWEGLYRDGWPPLYRLLAGLAQMSGALVQLHADSLATEFAS